MSVGFNVFLAWLQICPELSKADQYAQPGTRSVWFLLGSDPVFLPLCHDECKKKEKEQKRTKEGNASSKNVCFGRFSSKKSWRLTSWGKELDVEPCTFYFPPTLARYNAL